MNRSSKSNLIFVTVIAIAFASIHCDGILGQDESSESQNQQVENSSLEAELDSEEIEKQSLTAEQQKEHLKALAAASKQASSANDYSDVIDRCEAELREKAYLSVNQKYIRTLIAWSLNRRGESRMELGFEFDRVGNTEEAEAAFQKAKADFERAIQEDKTQWKAYLNRGIVRSHAKEWNGAVADFQRSATLRPTQTFAYFNLAEIEYQRENYKASLAYYDQILKNSKNDTQALNGRALSLAGLHRFDEALNIYAELLETNPDDAQLHTNRGDIYQSAGQWNKAEQAYVEALKHQQTAPVYRRLAWLFATCPDPAVRQSDGALVMAKKSISLSRKTSAAQWDALAAAMALNGDYHGAMDCMKQAMDLQPENEEYPQRQELYGQSQTYQQVPQIAKKDTELLDR